MDAVVPKGNLKIFMENDLRPSTQGELQKSTPSPVKLINNRKL